MLGRDESLWAAEWLALVHRSLASLLPPTSSPEVGVLTKEKLDNGHSKCKPRAPLCSPVSAPHLWSH